MFERQWALRNPQRLDVFLYLSLQKDNKPLGRHQAQSDQQMQGNAFQYPVVSANILGAKNLVLPRTSRLDDITPASRHVACSHPLSRNEKAPGPRRTNEVIPPQFPLRSAPSSVDCQYPSQSALFSFSVSSAPVDKSRSCYTVALWQR